ncbi:hypothetical protein QCA50_002175 [Cerrena zonata]|uniref:Uncharacterized protein n=1 Tax=Cerrena zonata TaxID=2478898 RepID=A0AAW0GQU9_9APHY
MSNRRRVGFTNNTSEASRRQLMQPVPCWEKVWTLPENAPPGTTLKVYRWVKTEKRQVFNDDEEEDQPLAPLPDEPEAAEGDEDMDQDEAATSVPPDTTPVSRAESEAVAPKEDSKAASPKPHPLSVSFQPPSPSPAPEEVLDEALQPVVEGLVGDVTDLSALSADITLDLSALGPDGEPFEGAEDIEQLQGTDPLLGGGTLLDDSLDGPFDVTQP